MQTQTEVLGYIEVPLKGDVTWVESDYPEIFPPMRWYDQYYNNDFRNFRTIPVGNLEDLEVISVWYVGWKETEVHKLAKEMFEELGG